MGSKRTKTQVGVVLALAMLAVAAFASSAQAWTLHEVNEGGILLGPRGKGADFYQAPGGGRTDTTGNIAFYEGAGTVSVCQSTWDLTAGMLRKGCVNNAVGNALNLTPYYGHALYPGITNNSEFTHTIHEVWYYGNP